MQKEEKKVTRITGNLHDPQFVKQLLPDSRDKLPIGNFSNYNDPYSREDQLKLMNELAE